MPELFKLETEIDTWYFTNAKVAITYDAQEYIPAAIKRDKWDRGLGSSDLTLQGPADIEPFNLFVGFNPSHPIDLEVRNTDTGDIEFVGTVFAARYNSKRSLVIFKVRDIFQRFRGDVPSRRFSPGCNWALGDELCTVNLDDFSVSFAVNSTVIGNFSLQHPAIAAFPPAAPEPSPVDGYFTAGWVENGFERVYVVGHTGDTLQLISNFVALREPTFKVFAGCNKSRDTCLNKFGNEPNFGGWPFVPGKNPVTDGF